MKAFFKQVLAVIVGCLVVGLFMGFISIVMIGTLLAFDSGKPKIQDQSVLHLDLSGTISERHQDNPLNKLLGSTPVSAQGLDNILAAIRVAASDSRIKGIYVEGGAVEADFASLEEIRHALKEFKKSGKFIIAYGEIYTQGAYYVASAADTLLVNPSGMIDWHGIASTPIFYKDLLDKVGVKMQIFRVGTYKSFVEPFVRTDMSTANRAQISSFVGDIWQTVVSDVAASRRLPADSLNAYADRYMVLADAGDYVKARLADGTAYIDNVRDRLRRLAGTKKLRLVSAADLSASEKPAKGSDGEIAVYYAAGSIVGTPSGGVSDEIVGPRVVEDLDRLADDDNIKAVVLRINSGGGSAYASEQMWHAIQLLRKKKPVVVSMGGMAASGGYYMSCGSDCVYAEPTTLTGSIGIFGMVPDASGLLTGKLGLHFDVVKTNEASDFGNLMRPMSGGESAAMQAYVDRGYALFLKRVAEGRHMTTSQVDSIAQGRVWTGRQALRIKLVDKIGYLNDAIAEAARRAKVKDYAIAAEPQRPDWLTQLLSGYKSNYMESHLSTMLGEYYEPLRFVSTLRATDCLQARVPYVVNLR